jgi:hypothetical protein
MTSVIILTALYTGLINAVTYGYLPLSTTTVRLDGTSTAARVTLGWSVIFMIFLFAGTLLAGLIGYYFFHFSKNFDRIEHLLILFLGFISLINLSEKREPFKRFIRDRRWIYAMGVLQGLSALKIIPTIQILSNEISFALLLMAAIFHGVVFALIVSGINILIALLTNTSPKLRKVLIIIISLLCIINGAINFFLYI